VKALLLVSVLATAFVGCSEIDKSTTPAERAAARLPQLKPCQLPNVDEVVLCGELPVPENPAQPGGRMISLFVVVVPAVSPHPAADPWVEWAGGPGYAATDYARSYTTDVRMHRQDRDVLLVDQRGMGRSNGLYCEELSLHRVSAIFPRWPPEAVATCRERLSQQADLTQYSTARAADDLEAVRKWLHYPQLNLFSYSYGARAALTYMHRYPASVRSSIVWGVVPPHFRRPLYYARDGQQAIDRLLADCLSNSACAQAFPRVGEELTETLVRLDQAPVPTTIVHPVTKEALPATITRAGFADGLWQALFEPDRAHRIPMVIHHAAAGDFGPFLQLDVATAPPPRRYYNGAHLSIVCPEETQHIANGEVEQMHRDTFVPADRTSDYIKACELWQVPTLAAETLKPVRVDVPTLIISGYMDPVTPPSWGDDAARFLPRSRHVVIRHLSHESNGLQNAECLDQLFAQFVAEPDAHALDISCTEQIRPPAFVLEPGER
jgi:pimeloyl-ACP methyl ester carboxylesterase